MGGVGAGIMLDGCSLSSFGIANFGIANFGSCNGFSRIPALTLGLSSVLLFRAGLLDGATRPKLANLDLCGTIDEEESVLW